MEPSQTAQYRRSTRPLRSIASDAAEGQGNAGERLYFLNSEQITMIDEALAGLGEYGEVRLVVEKGRIRYLLVQRSIDALKWQPGDAR